MATQWDDLHTSEQIEYLEWMETLQCQGYISMDISNDEFMDKMVRMYNCDIGHSFDPDDDEFLKKLFGPS